jgi:hypothetical protein
MDGPTLSDSFAAMRNTTFVCGTKSLAMHPLQPLIMLHTHHERYGGRSPGVDPEWIPTPDPPGRGGDDEGRSAQLRLKRERCGGILEARPAPQPHEHKGQGEEETRATPAPPGIFRKGVGNQDNGGRKARREFDRWIDTPI